MFNVSLEIKESTINGKGAFAVKGIQKGTIVWQFKEGYDTTMTVEEFEKLSDLEKRNMEKVGYLSPTSGLWVYSPSNDIGGQYMNHSSDNNLSMVIDFNKNPEPYFIANRDILAGEEVTNNYLEFDEFTKKERPSWV